jgi:hypothetical protein
VNESEHLPMPYARYFYRLENMNTDQLLAKKESQIQAANASPLNIFAAGNRGILIDILVFLINVLLMQFLAGAFTDLGRRAFGDDRNARAGIFIFLLLLFILQPLGAIFKRWQFHQRRRAGRRRKKNADGYIFNFSENIIIALLFNPLTFFVAQLATVMVIISFMYELIIEKRVREDDSFFVVFFLVGFLLSVVHALAVYRYFTSPTKEPKQKILYSPQSGNIGDVFLFFHIVLFQILWNTVGHIAPANIATAGDFWTRAFFLTMMALLVYLPSRFIYFGEDFRKPLAWFTIPLAISPLIVRFLSQ